MTNETLSKIYSSLMRVSEMKLPYKKSFMVYKLINEIKPHIDFCVQEEQKIITSYQGVIRPDGAVAFEGDDEEDKKKRFIGCFNELDQLHKIDVEINISPITLDESEHKNQEISAIDIGNLDGVVNFV